MDANVMVVMDSFALPVEGTETRVNAQAQGYEYMTAYIEAAKQVGRLENAIGWYHSQPGTNTALTGRFRIHFKLEVKVIQFYNCFFVRIWMLAVVGYRCVDTNVESKFPRSLC